MEFGLGIVRGLSLKKPGAKDRGYIICTISKNPKRIDGLTSYHVFQCPYRRALGIKKRLEEKIDDDKKVKIIKVKFELME